MARLRTLLIAESHSIAKAFVDALGLKRSDELPKLRSYASDTVMLAESRAQATGGDPSVAAAVTASYLLGWSGHDAATRLFHLGSCAARPSAAEHLGTIVLANRVVDGASGKGYYPDILLAHELVEAGIETLAPGGVEGSEGAFGSDSRPEGGRAGGARGRPELVDRELSGFLAAALTFLAPHGVYCLAAVTHLLGEGGRVAADSGAPAGRESAGGDDRCFSGSSGGGRQNGGATVGMDAGVQFAASMGAILRLVEEAGRLLRPAGAPLSPAALRAIEGLAREMRLTAAQTAQLRSLAEEAAAGGREIEPILSRGRRPARTKQERNREFDELKRLFRE